MPVLAVVAIEEGVSFETQESYQCLVLELPGGEHIRAKISVQDQKKVIESLLANSGAPPAPRQEQAQPAPPPPRFSPPAPNVGGEVRQSDDEDADSFGGDFATPPGVPRVPVVRPDSTIADLPADRAQAAAARAASMPPHPLLSKQTVQGPPPLAQRPRVPAPPRPRDSDFDGPAPAFPAIGRPQVAPPHQRLADPDGFEAG